MVNFGLRSSFITSKTPREPPRFCGLDVIDFSRRGTGYCRGYTAGFFDLEHRYERLSKAVYPL